MKKSILWPALLLGLAAVGGVTRGGQAADRKPVRVVIWDEQQPIQKRAYDNFLGNAIADHLNKAKGASGQAEFIVRSVRLDDPEQGLSKEVLDNCDVLMWWGHVRHGEIKPETAKALVQRIKTGQLSLIALHSAHFATPFMEAMNERTRDDALKTLTKAEREKVRITEIPAQKRLYRADEPPTPSWSKSVGADGTVTLEIKLPSCVFTSVKDTGTPSHLRTLAKDHPINKGLPETWSIPQTEIYGGPFFTPKPDVLLFDERWDTGETFPGGCLWNLGKGKVFYFRPGHETYPIFKQELPLKVLENATRWLGSHPK